MKKWRILLRLEYEWKVFRYYRRFLNYLVKKGMKFSSPLLCIISKNVDKHCAIMIKIQKLYEKKTGQVIVYYKKDEI